jgi:predicted cation transporter
MKDVNLKPLFGGVIVVILLGLYVYAVLAAISVVTCDPLPKCAEARAAGFTEGFGLALSTIGGLVSALVIAELAVTTPGQPPGARALTADASANARNILTVVSAIYIIVWLGTGLAAFVVGVMQHPNVLAALTDLGKSWLGLAVAAGYAYFALKPKE